MFPGRGTFFVYPAAAVPCSLKVLMFEISIITDLKSKKISPWFIYFQFSYRYRYLPRNIYFIYYRYNSTTCATYVCMCVIMCVLLVLSPGTCTLFVIKKIPAGNHKRYSPKVTRTKSSQTCYMYKIYILHTCDLCCCAIDVRTIN